MHRRGKTMQLDKGYKLLKASETFHASFIFEVDGYEYAMGDAE